jgi:hypothetical protein
MNTNRAVLSYCKHKRICNFQAKLFIGQLRTCKSHLSMGRRIRIGGAFMGYVSGWKKAVAILLLMPILQWGPLPGPLPQAWAQQVTQREHERAKAAQDAHDKRHHNTAKTVGGLAAGGALIGALAGGGKGALIGGAVGAGTGVVADKIRKHHGVKKRERRETYR